MRLLIIAAILAALSFPAVANCLPHELLANTLAERYGESLVGDGLARDQSVIELFVNPQSRTWTVVARTPNGYGCILSAGEAFNVAPAALDLLPGSDSSLLRHGFAG